MARVLVVEDDVDIAGLIQHYLSKAGYSTTLMHTGDGVIERVRKDAPDLVVLDIMLPGIDGLQVCRSLRSDPATAAIPIIMVTARAEDSDRIAGLELGADDYVAKPFNPNVLVARVRALLRRTQARPSASRILRYGPIAIDLDRHSVAIDTTDVRLTAKEFLLLEYLLQHRGRVLSRDLLLSDVWGYRYTGGTRTVDVHIRRLREKMPYLQQAILTVQQFGYKLIEPAP